MSDVNDGVAMEMEAASETQECGVEVKLYSVLSSFIRVVAFENGEVLGNYAETVSVDAASLSHNVRSWDMERL